MFNPQSSSAALRLRVSCGGLFNDISQLPAEVPNQLA
jgi:hypothetical protein